MQDGQASSAALREHALLDISSPATSMPDGSSKPSTIGSAPASHDASLGSDASDTAAEHDERPGLLHEDVDSRAAGSVAEPAGPAAAAAAAKEAPVPPAELHKSGDFLSFMGPLLCGIGQCQMSETDCQCCDSLRRYCPPASPSPFALCNVMARVSLTQHCPLQTRLQRICGPILCKASKQLLRLLELKVWRQCLRYPSRRQLSNCRWRYLQLMATGIQTLSMGK